MQVKTDSWHYKIYSLTNNTEAATDKRNYWLAVITLIAIALTIVAMNAFLPLLYLLSSTVPWTTTTFQAIVGFDVVIVTGFVCYKLTAFAHWLDTFGREPVTFIDPDQEPAVFWSNRARHGVPYAYVNLIDEKDGSIVKTWTFANHELAKDFIQHNEEPPIGRRYQLGAVV